MIVIFPGAHGAQLAFEGDRHGLVGVEPAAQSQELLAAGEAPVPTEGYVGGHPSPAGRLGRHRHTEKATTPNSPGPGWSPTFGWMADG